MLSSANLLIAIICVQCAVRAMGCQETCKCQQKSERKLTVWTAATCSEEPTGAWTTNIELLKMNTSMYELKVTTLQKVTKLKEADLSFCNITKIMPGALGSLTNLSLLRLSHNLIQEIDSEVFSKLPNLRLVYLDNNKLAVFNIHGTLKNLEKLFLQRNYLLEISQLSSSIQYLDASFNNITSFDAHTMGNLSYLDLCMNPLREIKTGTSLMHIKSVCLSSSITEISGNFNTMFPNIQNFSLISFTNQSTINKRVQKTIFPLHNVIALYIANTTLNNLLFLRHMTKIETLKLHQVNVTDFRREGAFLSSLGSIKTLDLEGSPTLTGAITRNFQMLLNISSIKNINLRNSNVVHIPCELCQLKRHLKVDLRDNPLECDCRIVEIAAFMPKLLQNYLIFPEYTKCQSPQEVFGLTIDEYIQNANCSHHAVCYQEYKMCKEFKSYHTNQNNSTFSFQQEEDNSVYYIILGIITGILAIAVVGLIVIHIILRKERRVEPQQEIPGQSFQQLQKTTSEDTLLDE